MFVGDRLLVSNCGDCRAVLCRKGAPEQLSSDHRPENTSERRRIASVPEATVEKQGNDYYLNGHLGVTRALGDFRRDPVTGILRKEPGLSGEPETREITLVNDDEFCIVASDGLWDKISAKVGVSTVRQELRKHQCPKCAAKKLVDDAYSSGADDSKKDLFYFCSIYIYIYIYIYISLSLSIYLSLLSARSL